MHFIASRYSGQCMLFENSIMFSHDTAKMSLDKLVLEGNVAVRSLLSGGKIVLSSFIIAVEIML